MAKGSRNGVARGKKGDSVYYRISGSNNSEMQGERQYVGNVRNPKTIGQASQRVRMIPAVNFYRAFGQEILDHSYQGVKYGARSHSTFMKDALLGMGNFPFLTKGNDTLAPGEYLMSKGGIPSLIYAFDDSAELICEALAVDTESETYGNWCQGVIAVAPWLKSGDQITFAFVMGNEDGNEFPFVTRFVLDSEEAVKTIGAVLEDAKLDINQDGLIAPADMANFDIEGASIIVSRPVVSNTTGTISWQRSSERMLVNWSLAYMVFRFFSQSAYDTAMISLMAAAKATPINDWYLNQGELGQARADIPDAPVKLPFALGVTTPVQDAASWLNGLYLATVRDTNGKIYLVANTSGANIQPFGYAADGSSAAVSTNLYRILGNDKPATDAEWLILKNQYAGVLTSTQATELAAENDVALVFTMGE